MSFESDYIEGAHPKILELLQKTNMQALSGYGTDQYCLSAKKKIAKACGLKSADVFFLEGGTQTNQVVIASVLGQHQGVLCAQSGHINVHEAGAIEYCGRKVMALSGHDGKIDAEELKNFLDDFNRDQNNEHMVFPGMVYISHPTEYGSIYSKAELKAISGVCKKTRFPFTWTEPVFLTA